MNQAEVNQFFRWIDNKIKAIFSVTNLFWLIYLSLLGVLLPHTAWAFNNFQKSTEGDISWMAWALAFAFEAAIFGFTHQLKERIEKSGRIRQKDNEEIYAYYWRKFSLAWLNLHSVGLMVCSGISALANFSYSVEFARDFAVYGQYSVPPLLFQIAFGGILPVVSFLFARILADTVTDELPKDDILIAAQKAEREARRETSRLQNELEGLRLLVVEYEQLQQSKTAKERILAAHKLWPKLSGTGLAVIAQSSPGYVSDVLKSTNGH